MHVYDLRSRAEDQTVEVQVWVLSCFPVLAVPSTAVEQRRVPFPLATRVAELVFPLCCSHAEDARILLTLISPICAWKGKTYRHRLYVIWNILLY